MGRAVLFSEPADGTAPPLPRRDLLVHEGEPERVGDGWVLRAEDGPFRHYERHVGPDPEDTTGRRRREVVEWRLSIPYFAPLFEPLFRRALRSAGPSTRLWWAPAQRLNARAAEVLGRLCALAMAIGYLAGLLTQTLTFAAAELGEADRTAQGMVFAVNRVGVVLIVIGLAIADRRGRRQVGIWALGASVVCAVATAFVPTLLAFAVLQLFSRNLALTAGVALDTIQAEELPAGARAYAAALSSMSLALGAGGVVLGLRLADLGPGGWRYVYLLSVVCLPVIIHAGRHLPESHRFEAASAARRAGTLTAAQSRLRAGRVITLGALFLVFNILVAPSSQFQNEYLRTERGFTGGLIAIFTIVTSTPAGLGVLLGGQLADRRGRRGVVLVGLTGLGIGTVVSYSVGGPLLWASTLGGNMVGALLVPTLGLLSAELFPTARRATGRAITSVAGVTGSIIGLLGAGWLLDRWAFGPTFALLSTSLIVVAIIVVLFVPETANRELEELNE